MTGFSPRFNAAMAWSAAVSAFNASNICEMRLCIRLVKFVEVAPAEPVERSSDTFFASRLASFFASSTAAALRSSNSFTFSIMPLIASAAVRLTGETGVS